MCNKPICCCIGCVCLYFCWAAVVPLVYGFFGMLGEIFPVGKVDFFPKGDGETTWTWGSLVKGLFSAAMLKSIAGFGITIFGMLFAIGVTENTVFRGFWIQLCFGYFAILKVYWPTVAYIGYLKNIFKILSFFNFVWKIYDSRQGKLEKTMMFYGFLLTPAIFHSYFADNNCGILCSIQT